jgi:hypothetical protein
MRLRSLEQPCQALGQPASRRPAARRPEAVIVGQLAGQLLRLAAKRIVAAAVVAHTKV